MFELSAANPFNPRASTPEGALRSSLDKAYISGRVTPVEAGYPRHGWKQIALDSATATFKSGESELTVTHTSGGWVLTGGRDC